MPWDFGRKLDPTASFGPRTQRSLSEMRGSPNARDRRRTRRFIRVLKDGDLDRPDRTDMATDWLDPDGRRVDSTAHEGE